MGASPDKPIRRALLGSLCAVVLGLCAAPAQAAPGDPLFTFTPQPPPEPPIIPPPNGYLNGPCGVAVDSGGRFYVADHYHDRVHVYSSALGYITQLALPDPDAGPCYLALDPAGDLYVGDYHGAVRRYSPDAYPPTAGEDPPETGTPYTAAGLIDSGRATGLAVDAAGEVYVAHRDRVSVYDSAGAHRLDVGLGSLEEGYGVAVSAAGEVYVADAATNQVKVYDPADGANFPGDPSATIDGSAVPAGELSSLRDASLAADMASGDVYLTDNTQPMRTEQPRARAHVFSAAGAYRGHLKYDVVHGAPTGIAVDNSCSLQNPPLTGPDCTDFDPAVGRVYVTSGNTHEAGLYAYPPGAATTAAPLAPTIPPVPPGGGQLFSPVPIGAAARPLGGTACEGDACQVLPPDPVDPTLTTKLRGLGNPPVRFRRALRDCRPAVRSARRLSRRARRAKRLGDSDRAGRLRGRAGKLRKRARRARRAARRCARANRDGGGKGRRSSGRASASASALARDSAPPAPVARARGASGPGGATEASAGLPAAASLLPGPSGFAASAYAEGGEAAGQAGSHPYSLEFAVGLDQGGGQSDLRDLRFVLPPGLLANPAFSVTPCSEAAFGTPRSSPHDVSGRSGESCPDRSQVGTVEVRSGAEDTRRFGLFQLDPAAGSAFRLGAVPFGAPLVFEAQIDSDEKGTYLVLAASDVPAALQLQGLELVLWGAPWDASHNAERGNCLNESEPGFPWAKCSVGEPLGLTPRAFLTLPAECRPELSFEARVSSWQEAGMQSATAVNRDSGGDPAPIEDCSSLAFDPDPEGFLSVKKASSSSGFTFRLADEDPGLADPRGRIRAQTKRVVVELPDGVTLNPSLGAGLRTCSPAQLARESAFNAPGAGCPNGSKIGAFSIRIPFYDGLLRGGVYLAKPEENPFDTMIALYLIAKSADRGVLISAPGKLVPDRGDGTLTATFDDLPQFPYTDLEVNFRSGQRAPLVSPPSCGWARTRIALAPWAQGALTKTAGALSPINAGIDFGPCPDGSTPPFKPGVVAGGVNSNVGSYTPYFVHLVREDTEQEITSYSLTLPKGIVGKLAGIPFCGEAAIARARGRDGFDETARPSCPAASQVGRTETGYGVGAALTYAPGRIYLAGPHNGQPLSLVTINAATVGPFDLGTIVVRSAFSVDPRTAQLAIDSRASDPIPHIIEGVPLHLRDVRVHMDRPQFTRNPTGCEPSALVSTLTGSGASFARRSDDSTAIATEHFQLLNCLTLGFRPRLGLRLRGGTRRGAYPGLRAVYRARGGDADLERIAVTMPRSLFLAQNHIRTVCTRVQFAAEACPPGSVYGRAAAHTPLFDEPLTGPVVLRSSDSKLPDLVASLRAGEVRIVIEGRIGPSQSGGIRAFFEGVPDAPVQRFAMWLRGGRHGLLVNSVDICKAPPKASIKALAHNNRGAIFTTKLRGQCGKAKGKRGKGRQRGKGRARGRGRGR